MKDVLDFGGADLELSSETARNRRGAAWIRKRGMCWPQVAGISQLIQLALESNLAREEEIAHQVRELFPSKKPLFWHESNFPVDTIRAPLREAERLLRDIYITDGPNPGVSETPHLRELRQRYGIRSDVLFAFGRNPPDPENPVTWERHGSGKARYFPDPES